MNKLVSLILLLSLAVGLSACGTNSNQGNGSGGGQSTKTPGILETASAEVQTLYQKNNCVNCHGDELQGRMGAKTNLTKVGAHMTKEQIADKILKGGNGMIAYKGMLNDSQVNGLADWLAGLK
jgi:cytochrome c551